MSFVPKTTPSTTAPATTTAPPATTPQNHAFFVIGVLRSGALATSALPVVGAVLAGASTVGVGGEVVGGGGVDVDAARLAHAARLVGCIGGAVAAECD